MKKGTLLFSNCSMKITNKTKKTMKQNIIIAAALFMICLSNTKAQDSQQVTASVARSFESEFSGASNIEWTKSGRVFVAKFDYENNFWVAYLTESGDLMASGRKIKSVDQLPLKVREGILDLKSNKERKFGEISTSYAVEMIEQGITKYYVPMENSNISMLVAADTEGYTTIHKKELKHTPNKPAKDLIAKKN